MIDHAVALQHLQEDSRLAHAIAQLESPPATQTKDLYVSLLSAVISQQLSTKAAATIRSRFLNLFENQYPSPDVLLALDVQALYAAGLSRQKAGYLCNIATFALHNDLSSETLDRMSDEQIISYLVPIKGVGRWTVEMLLMFALSRPDVFPTDDLGIQQAMINLYEIEEKGKALKHRMTSIAEHWRPYRTLACRYLWRWLDVIRKPGAGGN